MIMGLPEIFAKWHETNDMDAFFRAYRMAISLNSNNKQKMEHTDYYKRIVDLYYDMKQHPSDREKINQQLEVLFLVAETYIQEVMNTVEEMVTPYTDEFKIPNFEVLERKEKKKD